MNKSPVHTETQINGISVISLTVIRKVEETIPFVCVYDIFTMIDRNEMSRCPKICDTKCETKPRHFI